MELFDFRFELGEGFRVERISPGIDGACIDIVGKGADRLAIAIARQAAAAGFDDCKHEDSRLELSRGEQKLLLAHDAVGLTIQTYDPTKLPRARVDGSTVVLGGLRLDCGTTSIAPLRESHLPGRHLRCGAWRLSGVSASELVARLIDSAVTSRSLSRGGVFGPAKAGQAIWSGEAFSPTELVKVRASIDGEDVLLEIDLVSLDSAAQE